MKLSIAVQKEKNSVIVFASKKIVYFSFANEQILAEAIVDLMAINFYQVHNNTIQRQWRQLPQILCLVVKRISKEKNVFENS